MRTKIIMTMFFYGIFLIMLATQNWIIQTLGWKSFFILLVLWTSSLIWIRSSGKIF